MAQCPGQACRPPQCTHKALSRTGVGAGPVFACQRAEGWGAGALKQDLGAPGKVSTIRHDGHDSLTSPGTHGSASVCKAPGSSAWVALGTSSTLAIPGGLREPWLTGGPRAWLKGVIAPKSTGQPQQGCERRGRARVMGLDDCVDRAASRFGGPRCRPTGNTWRAGGSPGSLRGAARPGPP